MIFALYKLQTCSLVPIASCFDSTQEWLYFKTWSCFMGCCNFVFISNTG